MSSNAAISVIAGVSLVFLVPLIIQAIGAYRNVAWLSNPPPAPIFRRSSREALTMLAYLVLFTVALFFLPILIFVAGAVYIAGSVWA